MRKELISKESSCKDFALTWIIVTKRGEDRRGRKKRQTSRQTDQPAAKPTTTTTKPRTGEDRRGRRKRQTSRQTDQPAAKPTTTTTKPRTGAGDRKGEIATTPPTSKTNASIYAEETTTTPEDWKGKEQTIIIFLLLDEVSLMLCYPGSGGKSLGNVGVEFFLFCFLLVMQMGLWPSQGNIRY